MGEDKHPSAPVREPEVPGPPMKAPRKGEAPERPNEPVEPQRTTEPGVIPQEPARRGVPEEPDRPERRGVPGMPQPTKEPPPVQAEGEEDEGWRPVGFDDYDETVADSFPASDPPPGTMHAGPPRHPH